MNIGVLSVKESVARDYCCLFSLTLFSIHTDFHLQFTLIRLKCPKSRSMCKQDSITWASYFILCAIHTAYRKLLAKGISHITSKHVSRASNNVYTHMMRRRKVHVWVLLCLLIAVKFKYYEIKFEDRTTFISVKRDHFFMSKETVYTVQFVCMKHILSNKKSRRT